MGVTLALRPLRQIPIEIGYIALAKLVLLPAVMYLALTSVGGLIAIGFMQQVLLAALPTATNVFVISSIIMSGRSEHQRRF